MKSSDIFDYSEDSSLRQKLEELIREGSREPVPDHLIDLATRLDGEIARRRMDGKPAAP